MTSCGQAATVSADAEKRAEARNAFRGSAIVIL